MTIYGYEVSILVGMIMLLVWYNSLPYDNVVFNVLDDKTKQSTRNSHVLQNPNMSRISEKSNPFNIDHAMEEITKIGVYFVIPFIIFYKLFTIIKRELRFNVGY